MAKPVDGASAPGRIPFEITATREQMGVDESGQLAEYKVIFFRTALRDTGSIKVLKTDWTAEIAATLITQEIAELAALRGIK